MMIVMFTFAGSCISISLEKFIRISNKVFILGINRHYFKFELIDSGQL